MLFYLVKGTASGNRGDIADASGRGRGGCDWCSAREVWRGTESIRDREKG